jgi:single-strand DNA-binding protein
MNSCQLIGRLTKPVDLRYTPSGSAVGNFTIAVNRTFKNQNGEYEADFINCQVWKKQAENMANFTDKGSLVGITGRIQTRSYDTDNGKRYVTEVVAESVQFLDSKGEKKKENQTLPGRPFNSNNYNENKVDDPFSGSGQINIQDDDLPF